jgi:hypothetical protein
MRRCRVDDDQQNLVGHALSISGEKLESGAAEDEPAGAWEQLVLVARNFNPATWEW